MCPAAQNCGLRAGSGNGSGSAGEPGGEKKERAANLINIGNGAVQVYLSSAAREDPKSDDTILIGPPFYLDLKLAGFSLPIQVAPLQLRYQGPADLLVDCWHVQDRPMSV